MAFNAAARRALAASLRRSLSGVPPRSRFAVAILSHNHPSILIPTRFKTSGSGYSPLNDPSPNWSNRPPKETILLDGCDYEHWLIVMEFATDPKPSEDEMINSYVKTLATVLGSEEEAKKKIYSVCTTTYTGFGALISEELSYKVKGDLFVDGKVIHRPQYWFTERQSTRNRPRPRYDRRQNAMPVRRPPPHPESATNISGNQNLNMGRVGNGSDQNQS
ncbi:unnamed protein product [Rhodiola kirilowii]